jgi:hypothetical protein
MAKMKKLVLFGLAIGLLTMPAFAGPPFLTDDPEPVELHHYEFYIFSTLDRVTLRSTNLQRADNSDGGEAPAFEFNVGAAPNLQLHIIAPMAVSASDFGPTTYGVGDVELGAKYRFMQEKKLRPQFGVYPLLELPTGDSNRNLGNGQTWAQLPLWVQKSWGPWTSYGGIGYVINHAPGMRDHIFAGWLVQRELNKKLTLGSEWFDLGRGSVAGQGSQIVNIGGVYNFKEGFSLLLSAGHSFHGESHTVAYLGLYWTWGPKESKDSSKLTRSLRALSGGRLGL